MSLSSPVFMKILQTNPKTSVGVNGRKRLIEEDDYDMWSPLSARVASNSSQDCYFPVYQTGPGFNLDKDSIAQDTYD